jgi:hypothetical protein
MTIPVNEQNTAILPVTNLIRLYPILVADGAKSDGLYGYPNDWLTIAGVLFRIF